MSVAGLILATSLAQAAPVTEPSVQPVHVHFHTPANKVDARLFVRRGPEQWDLVCAAPCTVDLPAGAHLRAVLIDHDDEPHDFVLSPVDGYDVDVEARRGGRGALAGGIVMTALGGITFLAGALLAAVSTAASSRNESSLRMAGFVCMGVGGASTVGGIMLITNRTYEPRIRQIPHEPSRSAEAALPAPPTPLSLSLSF